MLPPKVSELLDRWLSEDQPRTLGDLIDAFGEKGFAIIFIVLLSVPALPLPTGGVTHVFEAVAILIAAQLIAGRRTIWLPARWRRLDVGGRAGERALRALVRRIRWLERFSRQRLPYLTRARPARTLFGALVFAFSLAAFLAPPFSGLDTLPALGVVIMSLGVLLADFVLVAAGTTIGCLGVAAVIGLGGLVIQVRATITDQPSAAMVRAAPSALERLAMRRNVTHRRAGWSSARGRSRSSSTPATPWRRRIRSS